MGDVADILGEARRPQLSEGETLLMDGGLKTGGGSGAGVNKGKRKPAGMSREVFNLIGKEGMAPAVVSKKAVGLKDKREGMARTRWVFTPFRNSARKDQEKLDQLQQGQGGVGEEEAKEGGANGATAAGAGQVFYHWVKAATDYPDYPFARFNVQTPSVEFTDEEYKSYLAEGDAAAAAVATAGGATGAAAWGTEETKVLLKLCSQYDLRWPVIHDRFPEAVADAAAAAKEGGKEVRKEGGAAGKATEATKPPSPQRSIEDLQARFYSVRKILRVARQAAAAAAAAQGGVAPPQVMFQPGLDEDGDTFDHLYEKTRRAQLTQLFRRSKEEELEELRLREELKTIDAALKRVRKHPFKSIVRDPGEAKAATTTHPDPQQPGQYRTVPLVNEKYIYEARPEPKPGNPYLQSARLSVPLAPPRLQKGMLQKVKQLSIDLGLAPRPLPTKTVCDLYDDLRRDMVELFTLQKLGRQKEAMVEALKEGQAESVVFGRQASLGGAGGWEGGMGGGMQGGGVRMGGGGGGGGGQRKSNHKKGQVSLSRQGSGQYMGGGGGGGTIYMQQQQQLHHQGIAHDSSFSTAEDRKRKR